MANPTSKSQVLSVLSEEGPSTLQEIMAVTGLPMRVAASAINDMKGAGVVVSIKKRQCKITRHWRTEYGFKTLSALETYRATHKKMPDIKQIIYALERARCSLEAQANKLAEDLNYDADFYAADAECMQEAIGVLEKLLD